MFGNEGPWSFFATANYLQSDIGIENPTPSRNAIHDHTNQLKTFGYLSYLLNDSARLSFMFGATNNRFQIPNNPDQEPAFGYLDQTDFNSADLNERQQEQTRFGVLALQGKLGATDYQVSLGQRYSSLDFTPDMVGDLMFNGVASGISRSNRASTLQADFATPYKAAPTNLPLGAEPLLVTRLRAQPDGRGNAVIAMHPAQGQGMDLAMDAMLLHSFTRLVQGAVSKTDWDVRLELPKAPMPAAPAADASRLN